MSLYDKASLALIPSGTKASTLYSVLPANGNGDFTHTRGSTATRVNKDGVIESVASNVPRLDYPLVNGVAQDCPALLLEPQRTNEVLYSVFDADVPTGWGVSIGTGTYDHELTSYRGQPAIKNTQITTGRSYISDTIYLLTGTTYTLSLHFDLDNSATDINPTERLAAVTNTGVSGTTSVTFGDIDQDTGIATMTFTVGTSTSVNVRLGFGVFSNSSELNKPIIFSMPQVEQGEYATSYIPTPSNSSVTRSADVCNGAGTSAEFNDSEGVLFAEIAALDDDGTARRITISDGTFSNRVTIAYHTVSNQLLYIVSVGGSTVASNVYTVTDTKDYHKIAVKYKENDFAFWVDGVERHSDSSGSTFTGGTLSELAFDDGASGSDFYGKTKQVIVFNEALTDAELTTLTS